MCQRDQDRPGRRVEQRVVELEFDQPGSRPDSYYEAEHAECRVQAAGEYKVFAAANAATACAHHYQREAVAHAALAATDYYQANSAGAAHSRAADYSRASANSADHWRAHHH